MPNIADILSRPGRDWHKFAPPLSVSMIDAAIKRIKWRELPSGLIDLYRVCNAGEGSLPIAPWNFVLWGLDSVADTREHEHYRKYYSRFVFFGSSGGGEYFGLDESGRVFFMDPVAGEESMVVAADSFAEFAEKIGSSAKF